MDCSIKQDEAIQRYGKNKYIISDGGITTPADAAKALVFADMIMVGNMLAGTEETPGTLVEHARSYI